MERPPGEEVRSTPSKASWAARAAMVLTPVVVLLGGLECWLRLRYDPQRVRLFDALPLANASEVRPERLRFVDLLRVAPWRDVVYELRPSLDGVFLHQPYHANAHGMRNRETTLAKPRGALRIAVVGDSIGFGWRVPEDEGFVDRLEQRLSGAAAGRVVETLNFCVPGYNTAQEEACLRRRALAFDPDLIVVQYFFNDLYLPNFLLDAPPAPRSRLVEWVRDHLAGPGAKGGDFPRLFTPVTPEGERGTVVDPWRRDPERVPREYASMVGYDGVRAALGRLAEVARAHGLEVVFAVYSVPAPRCFGPDAEGPFAAEVDLPVLDAARALGFHVVDLATPMVERLRRDGRDWRDLILSEDDWHPSPLGHALVTDILAERILEDRLLARRG